MAAAPIAMAVLSGAAEGGKMYEDYEGEQSEEAALSTQSKELQLKTEQRTIANYDLITNTLKAQRAAESVRGVNMDSPSFNAIQRTTINKGAESQSNIDLEGDIGEQNIKTEQSNVRKKLYGDLFGDVSGTAASLATLSAKLPSLGSSSSASNSSDSDDDDDNTSGN